MSVQHTGVGLQRQRASEDISELNLLEEALKIIDELFNMRLADKIARPKDLEYKQRQIDKFGAKMNLLHEILYKIRSQLFEFNSPTSQNRSKSMFGTATNITQVDWKKYIKLIQLRYNEVLVQGSFKHTRNICQLLGLRFPPSLQLIQIEGWTDECLESKQSDKCCCC